MIKHVERRMAEIISMSWEKREFKAVYIGRLGPEKGVDILLDSWRMWGHDAPSLEIIGDGPEKYRLEKFVAKNNLKNKINESFEDNDEEVSGDDENTRIKNRLLTYSKDKLISVKVEEIAFISTENSLTTITCLDGQRHSSNSSLDELYNSVDPMFFFRANR